MTLDYGEIGKRIARRRKELGLKQSEVEEKADLSYKYLSNIERSVSIPSLEVIMRLAAALDTTPDEFLVGTLRDDDPDWKTVAEPLRTFDTKKLSLTQSFLDWLAGQELKGINGYYIYRSASRDSGYTRLARLSENAVSYRVTGLGAEKTYIRVVPYKLVNGKAVTLPHEITTLSR